MDPSEYEGTVPRVHDPLGINLFKDFEQLLANQPTKFANMDLSKESDQIYITVFQIKESLQKWDEVSFNNLRLAWDEQALKIAEYKEEVAARKKNLASKIRNFTSSSATESNRADNTSIIANEITALITAFKAEFDFLTTTNRFSESAFLSTYKLMRDVPDPTEELRDCLKVCVRVQETLKNAQEQLNVAERTVLEGGPSKNSDLQFEEQIAVKYDNRIVEMEQKFLADLASAREKINLEVRNKEHLSRGAFERQQLDLQQQCEDTLARKDLEIASLMNSLNALNQRNLESEERQGMLETEVQRRRELEERLRVSFTELATAQTTSLEMQAKNESLLEKLDNSEVSKIKSDKLFGDMLLEAKAQLRILNDKIIANEIELQSRPPTDLSALTQSIGMMGVALADITSDQTWASDIPLVDKKKKCIPWSKIENVIVDCIRRASSEATESRIKEEAAVRTLDAVRIECEQLHSALGEKDKIIEALEKDLLAAHDSINEGNAHLKWNHHEKEVKVDDSHGNNVMKYGPKAAEDLCLTTDEDGHHEEGSLIQITDRSVPDFDIEKGSGRRGTDAFVVGESSSGNRMMAAVQGQRDRFMKIAHTREAEMNSLRVQLDRVLVEQKELSDENLELFRRLRLQRASCRQPSNRGQNRRNEEDGTWSSKLSSVDGSQSPSKSRSRRDVRHNSYFYSNDVEDATFRLMDGDTLERKYMHLYEQQIDPFKLEELDRQSVLSRMNIFERGLAYLTRFFLNDQWARHALIVYLFLVHGFALCYVFQVLNPQLIEEVDYNLKSKWSSETLNMNVEREHPDVRWLH